MKWSHIFAKQNSALLWEEYVNLLLLLQESASLKWLTQFKRVWELVLNQYVHFSSL